MNPILDMLMNAGGGDAARKLGQQFGLSDQQTTNALSQLVPALMGGLQSNTSQQGGMDALAAALRGGSHSRYLDQPETLTHESTTLDGNAILGHIFGSKEVSRNVAANAAQETGIQSDVLKQMLPIVATMVMGALSKNTTRTNAAQAGSGDLLTSLLDRDGDGSVMDDVAGMLGKFLGGR